MPSDSPPFHTEPQGTALHQAKLTLRRQMVARRDALDAEARAVGGASIIARLVALPSFEAARTVLLTLSFRSEWDTLPLVRAALAAGKTVAAPRVNAATRMLELFAIADPYHDVDTGPQGIPEPVPHCPTVAPAAIDWVLVPGVCFDRHGGRLGYGGGYYDRLLPLMSPNAARIAGAFDPQIIEHVPVGPHDARVDLIVTPSETIVPVRSDAG
jgi:5-formyltetrahydrofolate cyclo-ligase